MIAMATAPAPEPLKFDPIRDWVKAAKGNAHHAPGSWDPFDRWLDNLEKVVRTLEERSEELDAAEERIQEVENEMMRFDGIEEAIQDVGRGIRTFPEVLDTFDLDPHGIWGMSSAPVRESANSEEIALH